MTLGAACAALIASRSHEAGVHRGDVLVVDQVALTERVVTELEGLCAGDVHGAQLLYDRLLVHSLDKGKLSTAVCEHLARPCIAKAPALLVQLAGAADVDLTALRWFCFVLFCGGFVLFCGGLYQPLHNG